MARVSRTEEGGGGCSLALSPVSFVPVRFEERTGRRGPGRTILLDLCARAISRSSRDLPRATNVAPITVLFVRRVRHTFLSLVPRLGSARFLPR